MASLFECLLKTMPFAAVEEYASANHKSFADLTAAEVGQFVTLLPENQGFYVELPSVDPAVDRDSQPLWAFSYTTAHPAEVGSIYCRVHDADYVGHHVADRVAWGLEEPGGQLDPEIRVRFQAGGEVRLALTAEYLLWAFKVNRGHLPEDASILWRLESNLDTSIVAVFLFDIDPATGQVKKTDFENVQDPKRREELREMSRAVKELGSVPDATADPPKGDEKRPARLSAVEGDIWGVRVLRGADFWPEHPEGGTSNCRQPAGIDGSVGDTVDIHTEPARLMVVFSFTTCCERADFEPGGMVGFARCYPHLLVSATVPLALIDASAHIDRPKTMSKWHEDDRDMNASCCKPPYDGWTQDIGSLLVTDANRDANALVPLPYWSNMFYYYMVDPYLREGSKRYHVVRLDRRDARQSAVPLARREVVLKTAVLELGSGEPSDEDGIVRKEARQGMFDSIHMAPRLRLMHVSRVIDGTSFNSARYPAEDRAAWHFDDIAMAPFCAHDCLHFHWRWGTTAERRWTKGWDAGGPYRLDGAPLVPIEQDVWVRFRGRASITYHVNAVNPQPYEGWHVLMHHGFGYAVAIQAQFKAGMAMDAVDATSQVYFLAPDGDLVEATASTSAYYWKARYAYSIIDGRAVPRERLSFASEDLLNQAMDL
jgi:hypothetical protein